MKVYAECEQKGTSKSFLLTKYVFVNIITQRAT